MNKRYHILTFRAFAEAKLLITRSKSIFSTVLFSIEIRDKLDKRSCDILNLKYLLMSFGFEKLLSAVATETFSDKNSNHNIWQYFLNFPLINPFQSLDSRWFGHHDHVTFHFRSCRLKIPKSKNFQRQSRYVKVSTVEVEELPKAA